MTNLFTRCEQVSAVPWVPMKLLTKLFTRWTSSNALPCLIHSRKRLQEQSNSSSCRERKETPNWRPLTTPAASFKSSRLSNFKRFSTDNTLPLAVRFAENHSFHHSDQPLLLLTFYFFTVAWVGVCVQVWWTSKLRKSVYSPRIIN